MSPHKTQLGILVRGITIFIAVLLLMVGYFWVHKPFDLTTFRTLGGAVLDLMTVGALFSIAGGVGRKVIRLLINRLSLDYTLLSRAERFALEGAFGLILIALAVLGLGLIGLFNRVFFWLPLGVIAVLLRHEVRNWLTEARGLISAARPQTRWSWLLASFTILMLVLALLHSLAPVYAWDGMTYHLVGPQLYLADGRMTPQPENFYLGFPKSMEMLFSVVISLFGRDTAAAPVHLGFALLGFLAVGGLAHRYAQNRNEAAWFAVALLNASFSLWIVMGWPYVDLTILALSALAFSIINVWRETKNSGWLVLLGLIGGFAIGVKYTAGLLIATSGLCILVHQPRQAIRNGLIFGGAVFIAFLPWLLRGALHYGNPIFPYLLNGLNWDAGRAELFNQYNRGFISLNREWQLVFMPLTATIFGIEQGDTFSFTLGPWLFTLPFLLPVVWRWVSERVQALCLGAMVLVIPIFVFWAVSAATVGIAMQTRLMISLFPIMAVMGVLAFDALRQMPDKPFNIYFIVRVLVMVTLVISSFDVLKEFSLLQSGQYLLGQVSEEDYRFQKLVTYPQVVASLATLPDESQVRFLWEPRSYFCPVNITCLPDALFDQWSDELSPEKDVGEVFRQWQDEGDDYLLFFRWGYTTYMNLTYRYDEDLIVSEALDQYLTEVWTTEDGRYTLYAYPEAEG